MLFLGASAGWAQEVPARPDAAAAWRGRIEVKREHTSHGTPEESTRSNFRVETFLDGMVDMVRFDLPLPDEKTDFEGDVFEPRLGDVKIRTRFAPLRAGQWSFPSFVELVFPTADPKSLGGGKYQLSAGIRALVPVTLPVARPKEHQARLEFEVEQVGSVAGDPARPDIRYTKLEASFYDVLHGRYTFKLKLKPRVDWMQDGKTGAVGEIEGGMLFAHDWRAWLMLGRRLAGAESVKGTYDTRLEFGVARTF